MQHVLPNNVARCCVEMLEAFGQALVRESEDVLACTKLIDHFTVVCLVAWPLNESEAGVDLVLIEPSLLFICKLLLISMRTASLT